MHEPKGNKKMKTAPRFAAMAALAILFIGQAWAPPAQASGEDSLARLAAIVHPAPLYSTPQTVPTLATCKAVGAICEDGKDCCSNVCNPPPPGSPRSVKAKCAAQ